VARELDKLLSKPQYALKAKEVGSRLRGENGAAAASDLIEDFLSGFLDRETETEDLAYASRH
jgi:UDP:flavonoid glycosyltransferase YjiC (YdhE family)